uniref:SH2 domain-containing protein n=1 Tax=Anabas testudineus TaxID=64144 RepID=A0A7N6AFI0_ANATE
MTQWEKLRQLPAVYRQQLHELYDRDALPMDVRHYLSAWIEKQEWQRAARDHDLAMVLFQVLLENLDIQHSRFVQEESFLLQHNIRRYKQNFQVCLNVTSTLTIKPHLNKLLDRAEELIDLLVKKELVEWQRRQQKACIGAPDNVCLDHLEKWFTCMAVCLFQVREFLSKLDELVGKVSYDNDPIKAQKPALQRRADTLLKDLLKSSFVVETQPSMPQGKGSLVLRTNVQFSVKTRSISLSVTEELHVINFDTVFDLKGLSVELQASSLPVVIISNSSQQQSAWASVLWFNMLSLDTKDVKFFANCPAATWPQFGEVLSWQFLSATKRGLNDDQLEMIALRLFGKQRDYDNCKVAWSKFSKENSPDTFWVWFDGILVMVKTYLEQLWRDGLIMGFVSKGKEKSLLKKKQRGTFLLRFSESVIGGITFSWVEYDMIGEPSIKTVQPFTKVDLNQIPFHEIIRNFQILESDNIPENPLLYLYPNTPKDEAFGKYYSDKTGGKYIKTKLMFVSKE